MPSLSVSTFLCQLLLSSPSSSFHGFHPAFFSFILNCAPSGSLSFPLSSFSFWMVPKSLLCCSRWSGPAQYISNYLVENSPPGLHYVTLNTITMGLFLNAWSVHKSPENFNLSQRKKFKTNCNVYITYLSLATGCCSLYAYVSLWSLGKVSFPSPWRSMWLMFRVYIKIICNLMHLALFSEDNITQTSIKPILLPRHNCFVDKMNNR